MKKILTLLALLMAVTSVGYSAFATLANKAEENKNLQAGPPNPPDGPPWD